VFLVHRHDGQAIPSSGQDHVFQALLGLNFGQRDVARQFSDERYVDQNPARIVFAAFLVVVPGLLVELNGIRVRFARYFHNADDSRLFAVGMVEEDLIADSHIVTHHISGLVVSNTVPHFAAIFGEIVDAVNVGFGLH